METICDPSDPVCVAMQMWAWEHAHTEPHQVNVCGDTYEVFPGVFSPAIRGNSAFFAENVPKYVFGSFLEIGGGAGVLPVRLAKRGDRVFVTDISEDACRNIVRNAHLHNVSMCVSQGNLFEPVRGLRFKTMFWNHPWLYFHEPLTDASLRVSFDHEYRDLRRFFEQAPGYLEPGGQILLGTGSPANLALIQEIAAATGFVGVTVCQDTIPLMIGEELMVEVMVQRFRLT